MAENPSRQSIEIDGEFEGLLRRLVFEEVVKSLSYSNNSEMLTEKEAAKYLNVQPQTLASWRHQGKGPSYTKLGSSVRYERIMLEAFIHEQRVGILCQR